MGLSSTVPAQDDLLVPGSWLTPNYQVQFILGEGTFGIVAKCMRMVDNDTKPVAIKMIKKCSSYKKQADAEVAALTSLKELDPDKCNLVRWYRVFPARGHICLEFEHLDKSLSDFMKERGSQPFSLMEIRPIVLQLANALYHLKDAGIMHADLKLQNVLLVNQQQQPYRVKVIDFGLACEVSAASIGLRIQTLPYRSPEVILGLPLTEAIDMWSLGCMAAAMYLGTMLYPGRSEYDMMRYIVETQGQPRHHMLNHGLKTCTFFQRDSTTTRWKLKTPEQFYGEKGTRQMENWRKTFTSLDGLLGIRLINTINAADKAAELNDVQMFVSMLKRMLQLDATKRITPSQVLEHHFISMSHISMHHHSSYVMSCFNMMDVCQNKNLTTHSEKAVCGSEQQPPSKTTNQLNPPPHGVDVSVGQPHCVSPHRCTSTQTTKSDWSGLKRKDDVAHENKNIKSRTTKRSHTDMTFHHHITGNPSKSTDGDNTGCKKTKSDFCEKSDNKRKRLHKNSAGASTSSSSSMTQSFSQSFNRKMAHGRHSDYYTDYTRSTSSSHDSRISMADNDRKRFCKSSAGPTVSPFEGNEAPTRPCATSPRQRPMAGTRCPPLRPWCPESKGMKNIRALLKKRNGQRVTKRRK